MLFFETTTTTTTKSGYIHFCWPIYYCYSRYSLQICQLEWTKFEVFSSSFFSCCSAYYIFSLSLSISLLIISWLQKKEEGEDIYLSFFSFFSRYHQWICNQVSKIKNNFQEIQIIIIIIAIFIESKCYRTRCLYFFLIDWYSISFVFFLFFVSIFFSSSFSIISFNIYIYSCCCKSKFSIFVVVIYIYSCWKRKWSKKIRNARKSSSKHERERLCF